MTKKSIVLFAAFGLALGMAGSVQAQTSLVQNGDFTMVTGGTSGRLVNTGFNSTYWTTTGYNFLFTSASEANTASGVQLWGPTSGGGGSANGFVNPPTTTTDFVGMDGAYDTGPMTQSISGLTVGDYYDVTFDWAAGQQEGYSGITTDFMTVSLGSVSASNPAKLTSLDTVANHGFDAWQSDTVFFKANNATELLSFLNTGTPISPSEPPFALFTGVTMFATPEPSSLAAMFVGILVLGVIVRRRIGSNKPA